MRSLVFFECRWDHLSFPTEAGFCLWECFKICNVEPDLIVSGFLDVVYLDIIGEAIRGVVGRNHFIRFSVAILLKLFKMRSIVEKRWKYSRLLGSMAFPVEYSIETTSPSCTSIISGISCVNTQKHEMARL